jgi:hypothetical protein
VPDDRYIVLDDWIAIEKLVSPAPDEYSGKEKDDHGESESNPQRRNSCCSITAMNAATWFVTSLFIAILAALPEPNHAVPLR